MDNILPKWVSFINRPITSLCWSYETKHLNTILPLKTPYFIVIGYSSVIFTLKWSLHDYDSKIHSMMQSGSISQLFMWPGLQKQGIWAQTTPCHLIGHVSGLKQNTCILIVLIRVGSFMAMHSALAMKVLSHESLKK